MSKFLIYYYITNDEQLHKSNLSLDSNLRMLYEQESNAPVSLNKNESQEPANKNVKNSCDFFQLKSFV